MGDASGTSRHENENKNEIAVEIETKPRGAKTNARLCEDDPKRTRGDPGERREKHCSRQAVWRRSQDDRQMEGA